VGRHRQLEALAIVVSGPADVGQQAEVFAVLDAEALGRCEVPAPAEGDPKILDAVEVMADQFVEAVALVAADRRGDAGPWCPPSGQGTEEPPPIMAVDLPSSRSALGESVAHRRMLLRCQAPGRLQRRRGHYVLVIGDVSSTVATKRAD